MLAAEEEFVVNSDDEIGDSGHALYKFLHIEERPSGIIRPSLGDQTAMDCTLSRLQVAAPSSLVLETAVHAMTMPEVLDAVERSIEQRLQLRIGVVNAAKLCAMLKDDELALDVRSSDMVLADGMSVVWASRLLNNPLPERVAGIDIMHGILRRGAGSGIRVFLLGASEEVSQSVERRLSEQYPGIVIAGRRNGYFDDDQDAPRIADTIRDSHADVLFVAITSPKKERFMGRFGDHINVPVVHGVGGSFDVVAGKVKRAPVVWQKLGLEWLYRALQEPRRLGSRYLSTNWSFVREVVRQKMNSRRMSQRDQAR